MLTVTDRRKLLSCLALLSSDKDGEALAAGRAAGRLLDRCGVTWAQIVMPSIAIGFADFLAGTSSGFAAEPATTMPDPIERPVACAQWLVEHGDVAKLNMKDSAFVRTIAAWRNRVSVKQRQYLLDVCRKLAAKAEAYA
jgi:hypothetical protein